MIVLCCAGGLLHKDNTAHKLRQAGVKPSVSVPRFILFLISFSFL